MPPIGDHEGDLGLVVHVRPLVATDTDDVVAGDRHERLTIAVVDRRESHGLDLAQVRVRAEVPQADRVR